jgi:tRNA A-37 threonylcarbamoyl transferase component Bud32
LGFGPDIGHASWALGPALVLGVGLLGAGAAIWFLSRLSVRAGWLLCVLGMATLLFFAASLGGVWFGPLAFVAMALGFGQWGASCAHRQSDVADESSFPTLPFTNMSDATTQPPLPVRAPSNMYRDDHAETQGLGLDFSFDQVDPALNELADVGSLRQRGLSSVSFLAGRRSLGRYILRSQIGRGALGAVFLAQDTQIDRLVAIKTMALNKEFEGSKLAEARQRFFREAQTAGRLQHPNIVTVFDASEDDGLAYIAMEYIAGHDLQRHTFPENLLPIQQVVDITSRIADALAYAHRQGVVHRDVKPANVLVDTSLQIVKITDFGIARITDSHRTRTGILLGTPMFMSPEQIAGQRVDGRSDLYSLGVLLFQMLTGRLPYDSNPAQTLLYRMTNERAPDVRTLRPDVPDALARTLTWMLQQQPKLRCADGQELARGLRWIASQMSAQSEAQWPPFRA